MALVTGAKNKKFTMKSTITDRKSFKGTHGKMRLVADFLPSPGELVRRGESRKITISLSNDSIEFFKTESKRLKSPYQRLIKNLLQEYTDGMRNRTTA